MVIDEPKCIVEVLRSQYESAMSTPKPNSIVTEPKEFFTIEENLHINNVEENSHINNVIVSPEQVQKSINDLSLNSAAGPDQFPSILLKRCAEELSIPLTTLYNTSLGNGEFPDKLKYAKVTPIYKGGSRNEPKNYRPVALTTHISKVLEKIIAKHLIKYLEDTGLMNINQHGFRAGHSCLTQLLAHYEKVLQSLENNWDVDVVYLDFAKAFDKVDHGVLLHKLRQMGISGTLGRWLHCFLTNRKQIVANEGAESTLMCVTSGVPQGSVLGPLLFIVFIADIDRDTRGSHVASFADDTRVMRELSLSSDAELLQADLEILYRWADKNNMTFNEKKFEHMRFSAKGNKYCEPRYVAKDGSLISVKSEVKDLGVTLSCDGNFTCHINNVAKNALRQTGWILRTFRSRQPELMLTLYRSLVLPLLEYCCLLWSPWRVGEKQRLERVQRSFTSTISTVKHLDYWERLRALKLYSLERRRERYHILYIYKIKIGQVSNSVNIQFYHQGRLGNLCHIEGIHHGATTRVKTLKWNSFSLKASRLFNALPRNLRDCNNVSIDTFKHKLDQFLETVPDEPKLPQYHLRASSNSIVDQLVQMRADGIF